MTTEAVFNPLLPEFHANPYPFYAQLREKDPVHESPMGFPGPHDAPGGILRDQGQRLEQGHRLD